jgi:hypothetical protein
MAAHVAQREKDPDAVLLHLHKLVTRGPRDLDIASAMSAYGYDAAKWAEGQGVLAELVTSDLRSEASLAVAMDWCQEATSVARDALAARPWLLSKLGVAKVGVM